MGLREEILRGRQQLGVLAVIAGPRVGHANALDDPLADLVRRLPIRGELQRELRVVGVHDIVALAVASVPIDPHKVGEIHRCEAEHGPFHPVLKAQLPPDLALRKRLLPAKTCLRATRPMNLDPAPRLNKLVFLAIDAGLLITAFIVVFFAKNPYAPLPFVTAVLCVVLAGIVGLIPFFVDYSAKYDEYVQAEQLRVAEQAQRLHTAAESLTRAAAQIKAVEEAVHKAAHTAENLPYRMQEKLAEFNEALTAKDNEEREILERELEELRAANSDNLKGVADKIAKATADWSALESATRKQLTAAQEASAKLNDQLKATLAQLDSRLTELPKIVASAPVAAVHDRREAPAATEDGGHRSPPPSESAPVSEPTPSVIESVTLTETATAPAEESKPKKPRAPRKPKPEDTLAAMSAEPAAEAGAAAETAPAAVPVDDPAPTSFETSASTDGGHAPARHRLHRHRQQAFHPRRRPGSQLGQGRADAVRLHRQMGLGFARRRHPDRVQALQERRDRRPLGRNFPRARQARRGDGFVLGSQNVGGALRPDLPSGC